MSLIVCLLLSLGSPKIQASVQSKNKELLFSQEEAYIEIDHQPIYNITKNISISLWAKPYSYNQSYRTLISKNTRTGGDRPKDSSFLLRHERDSKDEQKNEIMFEMLIDEERHRIKYIPPENFNNKWHYYTATYDGKVMKLYIDGEEVDSKKVKGSINVNENNLLIGKLDDVEENWQGNIKDVQIWNRSLTNEEIKSHMNNGVKGSESNLVGYWKLDEGEGNTAYDSSENENKGTIYGATWSNKGDKRLTLKATPNHNENYIQLEWEMKDKTQPYSYQIFQKKDGDDVPQSIQAKETVKVLNVYPNVGPRIKYTTWDGTIRDLPKSASVEKWMETRNSEHEKGYGMGLIDVDPVYMGEFNNDPSKYLKDSYGEWKYDVIFFGAWDTNNNNDLTAKSRSEVVNFIERGGGVLFGHDTIDGTGNRNFEFAKLRSYVNIKLRYFDDLGTLPGLGSTTIQVEKRGLLTNYPWEIEELGDELNISLTHTGQQIALGDVWMSFTDFENTTGASWRGPEISDPETGKGTNNFYLTTWNNTAMIQTGHSNGNATPDEQKVLANTLFYLSQLTTNTSWKDRSGQDLAVPNQTKLQDISYDKISKNIKMKFKPVGDLGSEYSYYVEATGQNDDKKIKSEEVTTKIKSGLEGYAIVVDKDPNTIPDKEVTSKDGTFETPINTKGKYYIHVRVVDKAGNATNTIHYSFQEQAKPTLKFSIDTAKFTYKDIKIKAEALNPGTSIKRIQLPNGKWVESDNAEYKVSNNGKYTFKVEDIAGKIGEQTVEVTNILERKLHLEVPSITSYGDLEITDKMETHTTSFKDPLIIRDYREEETDWRLDVSATPFKVKEPLQGFEPGSKVDKLPEGTIKLEGIKEVKRTGDEKENLPFKILKDITVIDNGPVTLLDVERGEDTAEFEVIFPTDALVLTIAPSTVRTDNKNYPSQPTPYESTITWDLVAAP